MMLLNPTPDKASADLIKVFLCSSHTIVACLIGYGLALTAAFMATHYQKFRLWGLAGGIVAVVLAIVFLWDATGKHYFGPAGPPDALSPSELIHWIGLAFAQEPIRAAHLCQPVAGGHCPGVRRRAGALSSAGPAADHAGALCRDAALLGPGPLVRQRPAQPLVRLLVRP